MLTVKKCPWCGEELEIGNVRGYRSMYFLPMNQSRPPLLTDSSVKKHHILHLSRENANAGEWSGSEFIFPDAGVCRACQRVIIEYKAWDE